MAPLVRLWKALSVLMVMTLLLAACSTAAPSDSSAPAESGDTATGSDSATSGDAAAETNLPADAAAEQVLRINTGSTGSASFTFYPLGGGGDQQSWMPLMFVPPLYFDVDLELQPGVFDSWESSDDFLTWTFTIDPRAQWSDGSPITPEDVKGTWELMAAPDSGHGRITQYIGNAEGFNALREQSAEEISGITIVDESTLQVQLVNPDAVFHWRIATTHMNPVKVEQAAADRDNFWLPENNPVVSGPYMLESYSPDLQEATLVPNPNWWMDEGPYLDRIEFRFQPDPETTSVMLQNDQVDASLAGIPLAMKAAFPDYFRPIKAFGFNTLWINTANEPTSDKNVRQALVQAVDHEALFNAAFPEGDGSMTNQILDPDLPCLAEDPEFYTFDVEAAQAALAASEYGNAENLPKLRVTPRGSSVVNNRAVQAAMEFWRQNLGINNIEFQEQPDSFGQDQELINMSRDDVVIRFPDSATYMWVAAHSSGPVAGGEMLGGYSNPEIDALLDEALALSADDPQRCELALQAQELFMADYPTLMFGVGTDTINAREYVVGYEKGPDVGLIAPWRIYIQAH
ncbi:MAG: ABC transporter substrate-binding protein [Caldilineaceae bacterium]|nr:ABC transporter substrate-binding protein [Caldilineaceae bacterium]